MYEFKLFISGFTNRIEQNVDKLKSTLDQHLSSNYSLTVINIKDDPKAVEENDIFMTPTLVKLKPSPIRKVFGDISRIDLIIDQIIEKNRIG